jgi:hypothetical protein
MTQVDDRLKALFAQDEPAVRDTGFSASVMEKVMRRQFQEEVALLCVVSLVGASVLWLVWPMLLRALVAISQGLAPALGAVAVAGCVLMMLGAKPATALDA